MLDYLKKLDYNSPMIDLELDGNKRNKSIFGGILTIMLGITISVFVIIFGQEIYQRKVPNINTFTSKADDSTIPLKNFPIMFHINFKEKSLMPYEKYYDLKVIKHQVIDEVMVPPVEMNFTLGICTEKDFENNYDELPYDRIKDYLDTDVYCLNFVDKEEDMNFKNPLEYKNSAWIDFVFSYCDYTNKKAGCADDLEDILENDLFISFHYKNTFNDNLSVKNPQYYIIDNRVQFLNKASVKRDFYKFKYSHYLSDNGWIMEDWISSKAIVLDGVRNDISLRNKQFPRALYIATLESILNINFTRRIYLKIQDLLAKIGGLISGFQIMLQVAFYHWLNFIHNVEMRKRISLLRKEKIDLVKQINIENDGSALNLNKAHEEKGLQDTTLKNKDATKPEILNKEDSNFSKNDKNIENSKTFRYEVDELIKSKREIPAATVPKQIQESPIKQLIIELRNYDSNKINPIPKIDVDRQSSLQEEDEEAKIASLNDFSYFNYILFGMIGNKNKEFYKKLFLTVQNSFNFKYFLSLTID